MLLLFYNTYVYTAPLGHETPFNLDTEQSPITPRTCTEFIACPTHPKMNQSYHGY